MRVDYAYMEVVSCAPGVNFEEKSLQDLTKAMSESAIHTFGWPIAAVIHTKELEPKPIKNGIEAIFRDEGVRDYWTLTRSAEFYFIGELFENSRRPNQVFLDTRTNRITEVFLRVGKLYALLGVETDKSVQLLIKHGNIKDRLLGVASPQRLMTWNPKCSINEVSTEFELPLRDFTEPAALKKNVFRAVRELAEMFEMFHPNEREFTDPIVDAFLLGRIV